ISSTALGTTIFPYFSRLVAADYWQGLRQTIRTYTRLILLTTIPLSAFVIVTSTHVVRIIFERGAFTASDTDAVARVQAIYALVIPIETIAVMMSRVVVSARSSHLMAIG